MFTKVDVGFSKTLNLSEKKSDRWSSPFPTGISLDGEFVSQTP